MLIPVAQYVRMSTDDQQFSIPNQEAKIKDYATRHGLSIVRTYSDPGRSGVAIKHRHGLKELLKDVVSGNAEYRAILVYDVSRWGRFQNPDEAAHYEFICEHAGIPVRYCGEQFSNDGTMSSSLMKALKRTMAAEYSRELSTKVYDGQKRFAEMGYRLGGKDLYGLRRMAVSIDGHRRFVLERGERKGVTTDHLILVPGPKNEVSCIRRIFHAAAYQGKTPSEIAKDLNRRNIKFVLGRDWDKDGVWRVLRNPQYAGYSVWNRSSGKMRSKKTANPREQWILKPKAFAALVDDVTFQRAQNMLAKRRSWPGKSDEEIIGQLKKLLAKKGDLSHKIMRSAPGLYEPRSYYTRYGSYLKLYELVGYKVSPERLKCYNRAMTARSIRAKLLEDLAQKFAGNVRVVKPLRFGRKMLQVDSHGTVSVFICGQFLTSTGLRRWLLRVPTHESNNVALICLADLDSGKTFGHFVVPPIGKASKRKQKIATDGPVLSGRKLAELSDFCDAVNACRLNGVTHVAEH